MPTILFLMKYPLLRQESLKAKFDGQMAAARALGWNAYCIGWDERGMTLIGGEKPVFLRRCALAGLRGYDHTLVFIDLMAAAREAMRRMPVDVLYLRYMPTFAGALKTVRQLKAQGGRLIVEYPTYPFALENARFFVRRQVFRYTGRVLEKIHPSVDLYALIGEPCDGTLNGRPAVNIVNGVDTDAFPLHRPNAGDPAVRLLALASMSGWQGYDRILRSLAAYRGDADVRVEFVGGEGDGSLAAWQALARELGVADRVTFRGPLYGEALNDVITRCDVGVGSLGLYRFGRAQATPLKLREYMARGLPFLSAVDDPALPDNGDYHLLVPNDDTPVDMEAVVAFARRAKQNAELPARMRAYAAERLSWQTVMRAVLERVGV